MKERNDSGCFDCKYKVQGSGCVVCAHPNRIVYKKITEPCANCGRGVNIESGGCGGCTGRGAYVYPNSYDDCDCGGFERGRFDNALAHEIGWKSGVRAVQYKEGQEYSLLDFYEPIKNEINEAKR